MSRVAIDLTDLESIVTDALLASGASNQSATVMAQATAAAEMSGVESHGLAFVPIYCEHLRIGKINGHAIPVVTQAKPALLTIDADAGFAHTAINKGAEALVPLVRKMGIAAMAIHNSCNCGVLGLHTEGLASNGMIAMGFTNSPASIAAFGGSKPVIGTNPFAIAVPDGAGGVAFSIDQSASVVARSEVMKCAREGMSIPEGWALDADGKPTTSAESALQGTMVPSGGYKGVGIGLMVEVLAAAASGATLGIDASPFVTAAGGPPRTGQFFIAIDADTSSRGRFDDRIRRLCEALQEDSGARLPGQRRAFAREKSRLNGTVEIDADLYEKVRRIAAQKT